MHHALMLPQPVHNLHEAAAICVPSLYRAQRGALLQGAVAVDTRARDSCTDAVPRAWATGRWAAGREGKGAGPVGAAALIKNH